MTTKTQTMACTSNGSSNLERVKYFPRQLLTPADMIQEQEYFRNKLRRHNRLLHGWGVVCGAQVCRSDGNPWQVIVKPGYVLGPYGDEIVIDHEVHLDLRSWQSYCPDEVDRWCVDVRPECPDFKTVYVAVRYAECVSHPVRVYTDVCGCDEKACEYTRIRDSFEIKALTEAPDSLSDEPGCGPNHLPRLCGDCPECPQDPWVVLATVTLTPNGISEIQTGHRRHAITFADCFVRCPGSSPRVQKLPISRGLVLRTAEQESGREEVGTVSVVAKDDEERLAYVELPSPLEFRASGAVVAGEIGNRTGPKACEFGSELENECEAGQI